MYFQLPKYEREIIELHIIFYFININTVKTDVIYVCVCVQILGE